MYILPENVKFLYDIPVKPKILEAALQYLGVKEFPGSANNPIIMDMAEGIGAGKIYTDDSKQAWCAVFINHLLRIAGKPPVDLKGDVYNLLRAKWMANWGEPVSLESALMGDIVVIDREGGGHVFVLIGFTPAGNLIGIGGNQSNQVSIAEFNKDRVTAVRRYYRTGIPESAKRYVVDGTGHVSTNEA